MIAGVVLSGGGPLAVAWECGVASGLASRGVMLGAADRILGTSAGAIVGAQLAAGRDPRAMARAIAEKTSDPSPSATGIAVPPDGLAKLPELFARAQSGTAGRVAVGAYAMQVVTPESEPAYVARTEHDLGLSDWPARDLRIVAVDAGSGEAVAIDRSTGATLGQAVAASCSIPGLSPPVRVGERRFLDGGMRSTANADLIVGCRTVLLLCFNPPGSAGARILAGAHAQIALLEQGGAAVKTISPDEASLSAIGSRTMDLARCGDVVAAGTRQGAALANDVRAFSAAFGG